MVEELKEHLCAYVDPESSAFVFSGPVVENIGLAGLHVHDLRAATQCPGVINGDEAFAEDAWPTVRIGNLRFRTTMVCDRCVMTTIDPLTLAGRKEPIRTLARHRRWNRKTCSAPGSSRSEPARSPSATPSSPRTHTTEPALDL